MDTNMPTGETMSEGSDMPPAQADPGAGKNTVVLSADHFPEGMAVKDGDKLTFCVMGAPDSEGNVSGYFEPMGGGEKDGDSWEKGFKDYMSPTSKQSDAA